MNDYIPEARPHQRPSDDRLLLGKAAHVPGVAVRRPNATSISNLAPACSRIVTGSVIAAHIRRCSRCMVSRDRARRTTCAASPPRPSPAGSTSSCSISVTAAEPKHSQTACTIPASPRTPRTSSPRLPRDGIDRVVVAGYSLGGNLALKLAGDYGRRAAAIAERRVRRLTGHRARRVRAGARTSAELRLSVELRPQAQGAHASEGGGASGRFPLERLRTGPNRPRIRRILHRAAFLL